MGGVKSSDTCSVIEYITLNLNERVEGWGGGGGGGGSGVKSSDSVIEYIKC